MSKRNEDGSGNPEIMRENGGPIACLAKGRIVFRKATTKNLGALGVRGMRPRWEEPGRTLALQLVTKCTIACEDCADLTCLPCRYDRRPGQRSSMTLPLGLILKKIGVSQTTVLAAPREERWGRVHSVGAKEIRITFLRNLKTLDQARKE